MRTLFSFLKRMGAPLVVALAVMMLSATPAGAHEEQHPHHRFVPPVGAPAGAFTLLNADSSADQLVVRLVTRRDGVRRTVVRDLPLTLPAGSVWTLDVHGWDAVYRVTVFEDGNGNGVRDRGERRVRRARLRTRSRWAQRRGWQARHKDIVLRSDGGNVEPPPATIYPNGDIVVMNGRTDGATITRIDYNVGTQAYTGAYPNIPSGSWAEERLPAFDGQMVTVKVTWSDGATTTRVVTAPASATAPASVVLADDVDQVTPTPIYPNGSVVVVNGRTDGVTIVRVDYSVGTSVYAFSYSNVPNGSWTFERLPAFDGQSVTVKVTWSDGATTTRVVTAPASANAPATVVLADDVD